MKVHDFFKEEISIFNFEAKNKNDALKKISFLLEEKGFGKNKNKIYKLFLKREKEFSTGIGSGFAIPHLKDEIMNENVVLFAKLNSKIKWKSLDDKPVEYIFAIAVGKGQSDDHMVILSDLSRKFMKPEFKEAISKVGTFSDLQNALKQ